MHKASDRLTIHHAITRGICAACLVTTLGAGLAIASGPANPEKLDRQIGNMERALDSALVDSPNFLVTSGRNASGFLIPDFGVVFMFHAQLVDEWQLLHGFSFGPGSDISITRDDDGERQIIIRKNKHWDVGRALGFHGKDDGEIHDTVALYEAGKAELIDWLLDEGTTLSALGDGQYVTICARMNDEDLKHEKKIERLTLRAKIDDLKAYADDKLSEAEMKARIVVEES
jgi:hypothetical protein